MMFSIQDLVIEPRATVHAHTTVGGHAEALRRRRLRRELVAAVDRHELILHWQPRVALASGVRIGFEALLRWPRVRGGALPAGCFLSLADEAGLSVRLGAWVLVEACRAAARWRQPWQVSVNVSPRQIAEGVLPGQVAAALEESGLEAGRLELELAESALPEVDLDALLALSAVRDEGVGIGLDNFGVGLASLGMLKRLPLTAMNLDRSLVHDLPHERENAAIVRAAVGAGRALGLTVAAAGIDATEQVSFLSACGCQQGQGFLFGRPQPATAFDLSPV
jgi:EAL domain-containing protein (putative c-di-GMP-specific phosphodiesterase class I)